MFQIKTTHSGIDCGTLYGLPGSRPLRRLELLSFYLEIRALRPNFYFDLTVFSEPIATMAGL